jgi:hypothetical protein
MRTVRVDPARQGCYTFCAMLYSPTFIPLLHGEAGILDELLLFGAPLLVVIIILTMAIRRARKKAPARVRTPHDANADPPDPR